MIPLSVAVVTLCTSNSVHGVFHEWYIKEVFSNHDGSVQFIELFTNSIGQHQLAGHTLTSNENTFTFTNSPSPTNGRHLLLATEGFGSILGGATPNYEIEPKFFEAAGDTLTFASFYDVKTFTSAPTDGVLSLNYDFQNDSTAAITTNSPRNYLNAGTSVNLPPPAAPTGDYNGNGTVDAADYVFWRDTLNSTVSDGQGADGDGDGTIGAGDYDFWRARFGNVIPGAAAGSGTTTVPEPSIAVLIWIGMWGIGIARWHR
jgi:hypothetical protein